VNALPKYSYSSTQLKAVGNNSSANNDNATPPTVGDSSSVIEDESVDGGDRDSSNPPNAAGEMSKQFQQRNRKNSSMDGQLSTITVSTEGGRPKTASSSSVAEGNHSNNSVMNGPPEPVKNFIKSKNNSSSVADVYSDVGGSPAGESDDVVIV